MNKKTLYTAVVIGLSVSGFVVYKYVGNNKPVNINTEQKAPPVNVEGYVVKSGRIDNVILATGTLMANEQIDVRAEISGKITGVFFNEGQTVQKGQILFKIYDEDLQAELQKLQATEKIAARTEERLKSLVQLQGVSQQDYDAALNELQSVQADIKITQVKISKTEIRAPFSGKIGLRMVSVGAYVSPTDLLTTVQETNPLKMEFSVPEKYITQLRTNSEVMFEVEGFENDFTAEVYAVEPRIDEATRTVKMRARFKNTDGKLLPGAFAKIKMPLQVIEDGIMIPTHAVIPELKGQKVLIAQNGSTISRPVITGVRTDSTVQIVDGLSVGDTIITIGMMQVRPNSTIKITKVK